MILSVCAATTIGLNQNENNHLNQSSNEFDDGIFGNSEVFRLCKNRISPIPSFNHNFRIKKREKNTKNIRTHTDTHTLMTIEKNKSFKLHEKNCHLSLHLYPIYSVMVVNLTDGM